MTNKEWLDYLAQNAPDELAAWFDAEHVEHQEQALDGDTDAQNADSRERLEAEIDEWAAVMNLEGYQLDMIHGWLNRRAKIMERKMVEMNQRYFDCVEQEKKIAELQAKVDELTQVAESKRLSFADRIRFVNEIDELTAERDKLQAQLYELTAERDMLENERDNLEAKCDGWKKHVMAIENAYSEALQWRDEYRSKFGKCLDYADAIHALMDDEGMA